MSDMLDLMPASAKQRVQTRTVRRRWIIGYALTIVMLGCAVGVVRLETAALRVRLAKLHEKAERDAGQVLALSEVQTELLLVASEIERRTSLEPPASALQICRVVTESMPEGASLTMLEIAPNTVTTRLRDGSTTRDSFVLVRIEGIVATDAAMTLLADNLGQSEQFDRITLEQSSPTSVRGVPARAFRMECRAVASKAARLLVRAEEGRK